MSKFYLQRRLLLGEETVSEIELIQHSSLFVVLAEPGAGKTEILNYLANLLGTQNIRASRFRTLAFNTPQTALVIDAMDEVAKVDKSALNDIIEKARTLSTGSVVFASRSGEWEKARTKYVEECFGRELTIVHLKSFSPHEQKLLFEHRFPGEDFNAFQEEVARFDLTPLLGNPEFLQLFGLAYLENNKLFSSKDQIYLDAAKRLARESNEGRSLHGRPNADRLVLQAGSVFARLLLSGATGVSRVEAHNDHEFPYIGLLDTETHEEIDHLLDSKLFKPASDDNEHEPIHRIVAEYLAARYLAARISDPGDSLSMHRCLAIIAPNGVVRDELRGMLGWLAALGDDPLQKAAIKVDPYAVLANGDPAQLQRANKIFLLEQLQVLEKTDPYFRRSDAWRIFNVGQFFSEDTIEALRPILSSRNNSHLRNLVLELLPGTPAISALSNDLETFSLDAGAENHERIRAFRLLLSLENYDIEKITATLLQEASDISLQMLAEAVEERGSTTLGFDNILSLLHALAELYPDNNSSRRFDGTSRYFIKQFLKTFSPEGIAEYLDALTGDIRCICNPKNDFMCNCRNGISKIVGGLLDRYFQVEKGPYDPNRIWGWIKDLHFSHGINQKDSASVLVLQTNDALRQGIHKIAFHGANSAEQCRNVMHRFYFGRNHSGLFFKQDDVLDIVKHAYKSGNVGLWEAMWRCHFPEREIKERDELRSLMRSQSRENPELFRIWFKLNHVAQQRLRENRKSFPLRRKRYERREQVAKEKMFEHLRNNRARIEAGEHWWWLQNFARYYLLKPDEFHEITDDVTTVHNALRNCFPFLAQHIPTLNMLAKYEGTNISMVLHAACVLHYRERGTLENVTPDVLRAVKTDSRGYPGLSDDEKKYFEDELDRLLFPTREHIEQFALEYIEPSLISDPNAVTNVGWLRNRQPFQALQKTLPMKWLKQLPNMPIQAESDLFKMAVRHTSHEEICTLIAERCERYCVEPAVGSVDSAFHRRKFWLLNSFFYDDSPHIWNILKADKNTLLDIAARIDRFGGDSSNGLPQLSAAKIYNILDAFVSEWPKVHLPNSYGTESPPEEQSYRFIKDIVWQINKDTPQNAIPIINTLLNDSRFEDFYSDLLAIRATSVRKLAIQDFRAPSPADIAGFLERKTITSVEDMRALMLDALMDVGKQIQHADTNPLEAFYVKGKRVDENTARNRIVEHLKGYMTANRLSVVIEHHMSGSNRCDFTATAITEGARRLLTVEVKGQWHKELFSAATTQLSERYASHPDASQQGIYLVLWFGPNEKVADKKNENYATSDDLREAIIREMPEELHGRIDVHLINLEKSQSKSQEEAPLKASPATLP